MRLLASQLLLAVFLAMSASGCDEDNANDGATRLAIERAEYRREIASLKAELQRRELVAQGLEADFGGALLVWGGTAAALFLAVLLLARERRHRRVVDRLLRMIVRRTARPPDDHAPP